VIELKNNIRVEKTNFKNKDYVSIRRWYEDSGEMKPTRKGINFTLEEFKEFVEKFNEIKSIVN